MIFSCFTLEKVGALLGAKGMLSPLSNYWGGGAGPLPPPLPTPMLHEAEVHYLKTNFVLCHSFLIICMSACPNENVCHVSTELYKKKLKITDNLGVSVLLV